MLHYEQLKKKPRKLLALTGLTVKEFDTILPAFERAYVRAHPADKTSAGKRRKRKAGGGRKGSLPSIQQKLLFVLVYQKTYPVQALLGEVFGLSQSRANEWLHALLPLLKEALAELGRLPERDPQQFAEHAQGQHASADYIIDGTERRRQRPKNPEKQRQHYSGKKKTHTDKNLVISHTRSKRVDYLSQTYSGKTHDKKIADSEPIVYPPDTTLRKDTGFQGYEPRDCHTHQPKKNRARLN